MSLVWINRGLASSRKLRVDPPSLLRRDKWLRVENQKHGMTTGSSTIPPDDLARKLAVARPNEDKTLGHIGLAGDTYTILLTGKDTAGRYCLIDMFVPPGGGPPPHRHDFEEMFTILEVEIEFSFRGAKSIMRSGETI